MVFLKEKCLNWSFNAKMVSLEDIHTSNIIRTEKVILRNMCSYMQMQKDHEPEGELEEIYGRVWRPETEQGTVIILIS